MIRRLGILIMVFAVALMFAPKVRAAGVVKLGVDEVRSGAFKTNGDRIVMGVKAAVKEANEAGGVLGKKIEVVVEDNQMKPEIAVQKLKKLILQDHCQIIIQGSSSSVGTGLGQQAPIYKKIYLDVAAEAMEITGKNFNPYVFRTCLNAAMHVKGLAHYFASKGYKKVFLIDQDYSWGHDCTNSYIAAIKKISPETKVVGDVYHPVFNKDFGPYITKIKASGADYVITGNWGTDLAQLIIQGHSLGLDIPIGCTFLDDDGVASIVRDASIGDIDENMYIPGVDTPAAKAFEQAYHKSTNGHWPSFVDAQAYIGTKLYLAAVKKAGSFDTEKVIKAFEGLTWPGPLGTITMRAQDHQVQTPVVIAEVVKKTPYYDFPYCKPIKIIPADQVSVSLKESGWKPWKQ